FEKVIRRNREPLAIDEEPGEAAPIVSPSQPGKPAFGLLVGFEDRAEDPRQIADVFGHQKIMLHEPLDAAAAGMVGVAHPLADLGLQIEGQPLLGAAGEVMEVAANHPQELLGAREALRSVCREHAEVDEFPDVVGAVDVFRDPEQRMQVSQPALAFLDVRLELVTAVADALVAYVSLGELSLHELRRTALDDLCIKTPPELVEERLLAPQIARFEQRGADRQIGFGLAQAFRDRPRRVPDLEAEVPQEIEEIFDDLFGVRGLLIGEQKQEVDIGPGSELTTSVAAD